MLQGPAVPNIVRSHAWADGRGELPFGVEVSGSFLVTTCMGASSDSGDGDNAYLSSR